MTRVGASIVIVTVGVAPVGAQEVSPAEQAVQDLHRDRAADLERVDELTERAKAGLSDYSLGGGVDPRADGEVPDDHERTTSEWQLDPEEDSTPWGQWLLGGVVVAGAGYLGLRWWRGE